MGRRLAAALGQLGGEDAVKLLEDQGFCVDRVMNTTRHDGKPVVNRTHTFDIVIAPASWKLNDRTRLVPHTIH